MKRLLAFTLIGMLTFAHNGWASSAENSSFDKNEFLDRTQKCLYGKIQLSEFSAYVDNHRSDIDRLLREDEVPITQKLFKLHPKVYQLKDVVVIHIDPHKPLISYGRIYSETDLNDEPLVIEEVKTLYMKYLFGRNGNPITDGPVTDDQIEAVIEASSYICIDKTMVKRNRFSYAREFFDATDDDDEEYEELTIGQIVDAILLNPNSQEAHKQKAHTLNDFLTERHLRLATPVTDPAGKRIFSYIRKDLIEDDEKNKKRIGYYFSCDFPRENRPEIVEEYLSRWNNPHLIPRITKYACEKRSPSSEEDRKDLEALCTTCTAEELPLIRVAIENYKKLYPDKTFNIDTLPHKTSRTFGKFLDGVNTSDATSLKSSLAADRSGPKVPIEQTQSPSKFTKNKAGSAKWGWGAKALFTGLATVGVYLAYRQFKKTDTHPDTTAAIQSA